MPPYTCPKCGKIFDQKSHFAAHQTKKNPCDKNNAILNTLISASIKIDAEELSASNKPRSIMADIITNKEQRSAFYEGLHNLLWNEAGFNPEKALEHLTFFFAFRMIEDQVDTLGLPQVCRWSYVVNLHDEHQIDKAVKDAILAFGRNETTRPFFKRHEIKKADLVRRIMVEINRLDIKSLQETDTLGDLFEYMIGRGMSTMADDGQYFTDRAICRLAFELCHEIKGTVFRPDDGICTFADFFCGTGGFVTEYVKGVNKAARDAGKSVDWSVAKDRVYAADKSESAAKTTLLNQLIITGHLFSSHNIREHNSFADPLVMGPTAPFKDVEMDYLLINPPYGGDKTKGKDFKFKYTRVIEEGGAKKKEYCVNAEIQSIGIEDDDKVSAGVQLAMATLAKDGGVCAIVLPQGFFFRTTNKYPELRKKIAEEYKIHYVVDISSGAFANTGTKTSMMVFQRGVGSTESVKFIDVDRKLHVEASLEELRAKKYVLNYKLYIPQSIYDVEGFEMVKLGDILNKKSAGKTKSGEITNSGAYPFFSCKLDNPCGTHSSFDHDEPEYLLFAKSGGNAKKPTGDKLGIGRFYYLTQKSASTSDVVPFVLQPGASALLKYVYIVLQTNLYKIQSFARYTTGLGHIDIDQMLNEIVIPLPSLERQAEIVRAIDTWADFARREEEMLARLEQQMMFEVREMGRGIAYTTIGDVCTIKSGKSLTLKELVEGNIPVVGGGISPMGFHNASNTDEYTIIIAQVGSAGHVSRYPTKSWITNNGMTIHSKNELITNDYLYFTLKNIENEIKGMAEGTAQPKITPKTILSLKIPVPPLEEQQRFQSEFNEIKHKYTKIAEYKKKAQDAIVRLIPSANSAVTAAPTNIIVD